MAYTMWIYLFYFILFAQCETEGSLPQQQISRKLLSGDMVFPDSEEENDASNLAVKLAPKCQNQTFCEDIQDYPEDKFYEILTSKTYTNIYYHYFRSLQKSEQVFSKRVQTHQNFICASKNSIVYPKAAFNLNKELKFIYNLEGYRQAVQIEVCGKRAKCRHYEKIYNYSTRCVQKYFEKILLSADENGRPYIDRYKFPSACVCAYRDESNYSRFSRLYKY